MEKLCLVFASLAFILVVVSFQIKPQEPGPPKRAAVIAKYNTPSTYYHYSNFPIVFVLEKETLKQQWEKALMEEGISADLSGFRIREDLKISNDKHDAGYITILLTASDSTQNLNIAIPLIEKFSLFFEPGVRGYSKIIVCQGCNSEYRPRITINDDAVCWGECPKNSCTKTEIIRSELIFWD